MRRRICYTRFGFIDGEIKNIEPKTKEDLVPNIGWRTVSWRKGCILESQRGEENNFYFCHSYEFVGHEKNVIAKTKYNGGVVAAIKRNNMFGMQFHPERAGIKVWSC